MALARDPHSTGGWTLQRSIRELAERTGNRLVAFNGGGKEDSDKEASLNRNATYLNRLQIVSHNVLEGGSRNVPSGSWLEELERD